MLARPIGSLVVTDALNTKLVGEFTKVAELVAPEETGRTLSILPNVGFHSWLGRIHYRKRSGRNRVKEPLSPSLVNRDSATRWARRLGVQLDVGDLCSLLRVFVTEKPIQRLILTGTAPTRFGLAHFL